MKAIVLKEAEGPEKVCYEEVDRPKPKSGEVLVKLKYAALNRRDFFITKGLYPKMKLPSILGADGAGEIVELGANTDKLEPGMEVVINPGLNWGRKEEYSSSDFNILGMPVDGTYAQYVSVPAENIYKKPQHLAWQEAASLPLAGVTAYRSLFTRGQVKQGENVLIPGIGSGVALFALQMAVAAGANVYVTSSSEEKIKHAKRLGAVDGVNYRSKDWDKQLRNQVGSFELIIDGVGGPSFNQFIKVISPGGRIVSFGATTGPVPELVLPRMFFKNMDIRGTTMGSPEDFSRLLDLYTSHQLQPVVDQSFPLEQTAKALNYMDEGTSFGKIVLKIPQ
ncbi:alcohol dehydrogenase [Lentibacillus kapialis]|uniref:Alcohol dehydrogenase n=1 Tax=Lentibacillus kapialis TaxID=340214 RepID=A0A917PVJ6_9BACI|nr:zinc-binding dehydrogenase [Lentibacillus kapialis]GGJ93545.1 alcohol dehydrogenase [Lentibacillus kapialis]